MSHTCLKPYLPSRCDLPQEKKKNTVPTTAIFSYVTNSVSFLKTEIAVVMEKDKGSVVEQIRIS